MGVVAAVNWAAVLTVTPANVGSYKLAGLLVLGVFGADKAVALAAMVALQTLMLPLVTATGIAGRVAVKALDRRRAVPKRES